MSDAGQWSSIPVFLKVMVVPTGTDKIEGSKPRSLMVIRVADCDTGEGGSGVATETVCGRLILKMIKPTMPAPAKIPTKYFILVSDESKRIYLK